MSAYLIPLLAFLLVGLVGGFIAGLLGLGGGIVVVPLLTLAFNQLGVVPDYVHQLSVGTSMAAIIVTSLASAITHHKKAPLAWDRIRALAPGLVAGTLAGSAAAAHIPATILKVIFLVFLIYLALRVNRGTHKPAAAPPGMLLLLACGLAIGFLCSLVGVAGGAIIVPFLIWTGLTMHESIGTSAALGLFISLAGAVGYLVSGLGVAELPTGSLGFIHLPALAAIILGTLFTTPQGARLAHRLSPQRLRRVFAITMLHMAGLMVWNLISPYVLK